MADQVETQMSTESLRIFEGSCCHSISYAVTVTNTEVDLKSFLTAVGVAEESGTAGYLACASKNQTLDYHLHVSWRVRKENFSLDVDFIEGAHTPKPDEKEPYAEEFMAWVEKFFVTKMVAAQIHAYFDYPTSARQSKFPLPLKASIGPQDSEVRIDGISFTLSPKPEGVAKMWLTHGPEILWVHVLAERELNFKNVAPRNDIQILAGVVDTVLEEKKQ